MASLITDHPLALRILMDSDIYFVDEPVKAMTTEQAIEAKPGTANVLEKQEKIIDEPVSFNYLGENNKYLLILVSEPAHEFCAPKNLETLTNILKAKQLELKDIALVNIAKHTGVHFESLKAYLACSKIALFGINPAQIGLKEITSNQITSTQGVKILATFSFAEMEEDVTKKRIFWNEMKKL